MAFRTSLADLKLASWRSWRSETSLADLKLGMSGTISVHLGDHGVQNFLSRLEVGIVWHGLFAASRRSWRSENVFSRPEIGNGTISLHLGDHGVQNVLSRLAHREGLLTHIHGDLQRQTVESKSESTIQGKRRLSEPLGPNSRITADL